MPFSQDEGHHQDDWEFSRYLRLILILIVIAWMGIAWWVRNEYLPYDSPNTDWATSLFQAQTFAAGEMSRSTPEPREFFQQWQAVVRDRSYAYYAPLHGALLAIPLALGLDPWLVPWICSGGCLILMFAWARRVVSERVALIAVAALALSPFFASNAPSLLAHSTCLFVTLFCLWSFMCWRRGGETWSAALAGLALGCLFAHRSLNAVAFGAVWIPWVIWSRRESIRKEVVACVSFAAVAIGVVGALALYYHALCGRWVLELFTDYWPRNRYGFGANLGRGEPGHFFQTSATHDWGSWFGNLGYYFVETGRWWSGSLSLSLVLGLAIAWAGYRALVLKREGVVDDPRYGRTLLVALLAWPIVHVVLYAFYFTPSLPDSSRGFAFVPWLDRWFLPARTGYTGPRYVFEIIPVLALLSGWGLAWLAAHDRRIFAVLAAVLLTSTTWFKIDYCERHAKRLPAQRMVAGVVREGVHPPALVLIRSFWIGLPFPIFLNPPSMSGPILYACDRGAEDRRLAERFPERNIYVLVVAPPSGGSPAKVELVPVYDPTTRRWLTDPGKIEAPFWIGSGFTKPVRLEGETARRYFHPRPDEIIPQ
jgi:hypothetical protein